MIFGSALFNCCAIFPKQSSRGPLIQLLLDAGADVNAKTSDGETPLAIGLGLSGWRSPDDARASLDMITRLLRAGAALDAIRGDNLSIEDLLREDLWLLVGVAELGCVVAAVHFVFRFQCVYASLLLPHGGRAAQLREEVGGVVDASTTTCSTSP